MQLCLEISDELFQASINYFDPDMHFAEGMTVQWRIGGEVPTELEFIEQTRYLPLYGKIRETLLEQFGSVLGKFVRNAVTRGELVPLPFEVYWSVAYAPLYPLLKFHAQEKSWPAKKFRSQMK